MRHFVKIVNRGTYTNANKAQFYVERELAVPVEHDEHGRLTAIQMLEAAELALLRSLIKKENRVSNQDDGISRRWVNRESGRTQAPAYAHNGKLLDTKTVDGVTTCGLIVKSPGGLPILQLKEVKYVGTGRSVAHRRDDLTRRQHGRDKGRSVLSEVRC